MKVTGSKRVISLGGGGISANEAASGMKQDGVDWCVFALGRGREEKHPTLLDWAAKTEGVTFVRGKDPNEQQGFAVKKEKEAVAPAVTSVSTVSTSAERVSSVTTLRAQ